VAKVEPLFTFTNDKGEIEGVKYDRISVVLINAIKELKTENEMLTQKLQKVEQQQVQIKQQQVVIEGLKKIVCTDHPQAELCR
jgi:type III secretory pathway lipoprotein EscJ